VSKKKRPSRPELIKKFFPELDKAKGSLGDKEAAIGINTRATEAILQDFIGNYDKGYNQLGPGALAIRLAKDAASNDAEYLTLQDLEEDARLAAKNGDTDLQSTLEAVVSYIIAFNPNKAALLMLVDSGLRMFPIDRDKPASAITALMEEFQQ
jgi:hypothetical protein